MTDLGPVLRLEGRTITRLRRVFYVFKGEVDRHEGPIEIHSGDDVFWLRPGGDGEAMRVTDGAWEDPFAPPLSPVNEEFVATSGKWTAFDVSEEEPYRRFIGAKVVSIATMMLTNAKVVGSVFYTTAGVIRAEVLFDELNVTVTPWKESQETAGATEADRTS